MAGFKVPKRTRIVLEFGGDDELLAPLEGLEVSCHSMSTAEEEAVEARIQDGEMIATLVEDVIIEWNLTDDEGEPITVSRKALSDLDPWVPQAIYRAWVRGLMTPPKASSPVSTNGTGRLR